MGLPKGRSGNPAGRPPGSTPGAKIREAILKRSDEILNSVIAKAVSGDMMAAKILLDRLTPVLRAQTVPVTLSNHSVLAEQGKEIIRATVSGEIPPDIGSQLITALANQAKIVEVDELTKRIEALENK